jgi:DNA repair protein RadC
MSKKKNTKSIKNWAKDDRPREKLMRLGARNLTDAELLAIIISSGNMKMSAVDLSRYILSEMDNDLNILSKKSYNELMKFPGIGEAKAVSIVAAMELINRKKFDKVPNRKITGSKDVYEEMYPVLSNLEHEEFWVLFLDRKNVIIHKKEIGKGGVAGTYVDLKIIFKKALELTASGMILVHNHPSGNTTPSSQDISLTEKIKKAAVFLDISLLDHIIFGGIKYFSFVDEGIL